MTLHLLKMCVGIAEVDELAAWQKQRWRRMKAAGEKPRLHHLTRHTPRRAAEILDGGSLYWVIKSQVRVRQRIVAIETAENQEGETKCALVLDRKLVRTLPQPRRPHQGWRYLDPADAPVDLADAGAAADMPPGLVEELRALGLL